MAMGSLQELTVEELDRMIEETQEEYRAALADRYTFELERDQKIVDIRDLRARAIIERQRKMGKKPLVHSMKGLMSIALADSFINIWEGAVRSSKTVSSIIAFLAHVEKSPYKEFLITGQTENTVYRNVIGGEYGIIALMGGPTWARFRRSQEGGSRLIMRFRDRKWKGKHPRYIEKVAYVVGMNDQRAEGKIRGMTTAGWYADEVTLYPESAVKQAINRMSLPGAKAFWTCNPDSPYHYVKTEFIDKAQEKGYRVFHFTLDDNLALDEEYKRRLKQAYRGLWYKRMVEGLWVMADGVIYDLFDHERHVTTKIPEIKRTWVGIDQGHSNATVFLLVGEGDDGKAYVLNEWYHSGADGRQRSPSQYAQDFKRWMEEQIDSKGNQYYIEKIFVDPSAKGFILELYQALDSQTRRKIIPAFNDVKIGIEVTSTIIGHDQLYVHPRCRNFLREISSYVWDPNAQKKGEDKPLKENDHVMDALRYVMVGTRRIWENLRKAKGIA